MRNITYFSLLFTSFFLSFCLFSAIALKVFYDRQEMHEIELSAALNSYSNKLEKALDNALLGPYLVRAAMRDFTYTQTEFETLATEILTHSDGSQTIQLAPKGVIQYSYPLTSHESVIGVDLFKMQSIQASLQTAIDTQKMRIDGPKELAQGGQGLVARLPIFDQNEFWGFAIAVLRFPEFIANLSPESTSPSHLYEVWQKTANNYAPLLNNHRFEQSHWSTYNLDVENQQWVVGIKDEFAYRAHVEFLVLLLIALLLSSVSCYLITITCRLREHEQNLEKLVQKQTLELSEQALELKQAQSLSGVGSWHLSPDKSIRQLSSQAKSLFKEQSKAQSITDVCKKIDSFYKNSFLNFIHTKPSSPTEIEYTIKLNGEKRWFHEHAEWNSKTNTLVGTIKDISTEKQRQHELYQQAHFDSITGLANRHYSEKYIASLCPEDQYSSGLTLLCAEIKGYRQLEDIYGQDYLNELQTTIANRLIEFSDLHQAFCAHIKPGCFLILLKEAIFDEKLAALLDKLQHQVGGIIETAGSAHFYHLYIGVGYPHLQNIDAAEQINTALIAMNECPRTQKPFTVYSQSLKEKLIAQSNLESDLRHALAANEQLSMVYQPIVNTIDGTLIGCEALVRWQHPVRGFVSPVEFITIAEQSELINLLSRWIVAKVAEDCHRMVENNIRIKVSINLSRKQFSDVHLVKRLSKEKAKLFPANQKINLEITESALFQNTQYAINLMHELKLAGFNLSLDDFGTGYSSLSSIQQFPLDNVKIDRAFICNCVDNPRDGLFLQTMSDLAHQLDLTITAEGVESSEQWQLVSDKGIDYIQGYLISMPLSIDDFIAFDPVA